MHHETSRNGMKLNESDQGAIGLRQGPGVSGPTGNRRVASVPWRAARGRAPRTAQGWWARSRGLSRPPYRRRFDL
jgi:hypothetical protein